VGPGCKIIACLKANAYGHGAVRLAQVLVEHGADILAVGNLEEGVQLRAQGIGAPVLVFGNSLPDAAYHYLDHGLIPTVYDLQTARVLSSLAASECTVYVKVETGLERLGVVAEEACSFIKELLLLARIRVGGIYTHFGPAAGAEDKSYVRWQYGRFTQVLHNLEREGIHIAVQQAANSGALVDLPDTYLTAVCPGKALYGSVKTAAPQVQATFRPAFVAIKSRVVQIRHASGGAPSGGRGASRASRMAVIPIGQADGFASRLANGGEALIRGKRAPVIGAVSLEHTKLDITDVPDAQVGDEVALAGRQGGAEITLDETGQMLQCDGREVLGRFAGRLPHVYFRGGLPVWLTWRFGHIDLLMEGT
jgi:alanine racemase